MMNPFTLSFVYSIHLLVYLYVHRFLDLSACRLYIKNNKTSIVLQFHLKKKTLIVTSIQNFAIVRASEKSLQRKLTTASKFDNNLNKKSFGPKEDREKLSCLALCLSV